MTLQTLLGFVGLMKKGPRVSVPRSHSWARHMKHLACAERVFVLDERDFERWQKLLPLVWEDAPVRCLRSQGGFKLFWREGREFFCRQLTIAQSREFAFLAGMLEPHLEPLAGVKICG